MRLAFIALVLIALLAVSAEGARKKPKNNHRDREETASRQVEEDQPLSGRREDEQKQKEKKVKEEKPLKKADESSSEEEEEEKEKSSANKTTPAPQKRRRAVADGNSNDLLDELPLNPSDADMHQHHHQSGRKRRSENTHAQTGEVILTRAQELNDGERTPLVIDEKAGSRPDYRKNSRTRRSETTLGRAQELNGGERTEISKGDETASRPDYRRKNSRTRRTLQKRRLRNHVDEEEEMRNNPHYIPDRHRQTYPTSRRRRNLKDGVVGSSEEDTLKKAQELNDGIQRPVDKLPSQSQMPDGKRAHKRRHARQLNTVVAQPGNQFDERDTEEWKVENEEDYDTAGNY